MLIDILDSIFAPFILALYFASSLDNVAKVPVKTTLLLEKKLFRDLFSNLLIATTLINSSINFLLSFIEKNFVKKTLLLGPNHQH